MPHTFLKVKNAIVKYTEPCLEPKERLSKGCKCEQMTLQNRTFVSSA